MTFEEEEKEAIAARERKLALKQAKREAPRSVRRALSEPVVTPKAIIVTHQRRSTEADWKAWSGTRNQRR